MAVLVTAWVYDYRVDDCGDDRRNFGHVGRAVLPCGDYQGERRGSTTTWQEMVDEGEGGMVDVFSGSDLVGTNGVPYNQW